MIIAPPLALYIHLPWCIQKCPYCDFNSHALRSELPEQMYCERLISDLEQDLQSLEKRELISIFFGGGTPSLFKGSSIAYLLDEIQKRIPFTENIEITLEANPGTVDTNRFHDFYKAGVNRLSVGIQSFQADKLKILGRIHDDRQAIKAVEALYQAGFTNFNLDLMHGLPNQTVQDALYDLNTAISLQPKHISWYQLTIEPHTLFAHKPPQLPDEEILWDIQGQGQQLLAENNFSQYEISAYTQKNHTCVHNRNYWEYGDYLGIGAGAHSKITDVVQQKIIRTHKVKNPKDYLAKNFIAEQIIVSQQEIPYEFMLNALRLFQAIPISLYQQRTGLALDSIIKPLKIAKEKSLITWDEKEIKITELGHRFYNDLVALFIP